MPNMFILPSNPNSPLKCSTFMSTSAAQRLSMWLFHPLLEIILWAIYVYHPGMSTIQHTDSLDSTPKPDVLPILQWVFAGVHEIPITQIKSIVVAKQGGNTFYPPTYSTGIWKFHQNLPESTGIDQNPSESIGMGQNSQE